MIYFVENNNYAFSESFEKIRESFPKAPVYVIEDCVDGCADKSCFEIYEEFCSAKPYDGFFEDYSSDYMYEYRNGEALRKRIMIPEDFYHQAEIGIIPGSNTYDE